MTTFPISMPSLNLRSSIPLFVLTGLIASGVSYFLGHRAAMDSILLVTLIIGSLPLAWEIIQSMIRGHFGVDLIAIVAIGASLTLHQYLAGTVILLMLSGGEALEGYALRRARKDLTDLIERAPTKAHKKMGMDVTEVPIESIVIGDAIVVKPGEIIPVDGEVEEGISMVDESALTGESMLVEKRKGASVMSGSISKDGLLEIRALKASHESKYEQIIKLVRDAEQQKAPFVRLADRYSVFFTIITFVLAIAAWLLSKDPIRVLAVLVVATPCPLILATPIAFASGISRAAKRGIIVKNGGALEKLGEARSFAFDKTGTLTLGVPTIASIDGITLAPEKVLHIAASLDQLSVHILARGLLQHAREAGLTLAYPTSFSESIGEGVQGIIDGKQYSFGRIRFLQQQHIVIDKELEQLHDVARTEGKLPVYLADDKKVIGTIFFQDTVRPNVRALFTHLTSLGIKKTLLITGDKKPVAIRIAKEVGLPEDDVRSEMLPEQKVEEVKKLRTAFSPTIMVGDGINDAPALAAADVGIAMGGHGNTASSESGDIVILVDKIERVGEALLLGHRVLSIAKEGVWIGMILSIGLMIIAAFGFIIPVYGALLQELIDVVVIFNALRVLIAKTTIQ